MSDVVSLMFVVGQDGKAFSHIFATCRHPGKPSHGPVLVPISQGLITMGWKRSTHQDPDLILQQEICLHFLKHHDYSSWMLVDSSQLVELRLYLPPYTSKEELQAREIP